MRWGLVGGGLGAYAIALIIIAPATLVDATIDRASSGKFRLTAARGTVWSGAGRLEARDARQRIALAEELSWHFRPISLLRGRLYFEVQSDPTTKRFPLTISFSGVELANAEILLPAAVIGIAFPKLALLDLSGQLSLRAPRLVVDREGIHGNATLQLRAVSSAFTPVSPLGDYELRIEDAADIVRASLRTLQGPLQLDGSGTWTSGSKPVLKLSALVPLEHQQQLAPLLRSIAVDRGDGRFELELK